jgi:hypothetical protein
LLLVILAFVLKKIISKHTMDGRMRHCEAKRMGGWEDGRMGGWDSVRP